MIRSFFHAAIVKKTVIDYLECCSEVKKFQDKGLIVGFVKIELTSDNDLFSVEQWEHESDCCHFKRTRRFGSRNNKYGTAIVLLTFKKMAVSLVSSQIHPS